MRAIPLIFFLKGSYEEMRVSVSIVVSTKQSFLSSRCLKQNAKQNTVCSTTFHELETGKAKENELHSTNTVKAIS